MRKLLVLLAFFPSIVFAQFSGGGITLSQAAGAAPVQSVAGRSGAVVIGIGDVSGAAPLASPTFTGSPVVPGYLTITSAGTTYAPIASPTFTGIVTSPTITATSALNTVNFSRSGPEKDTTLTVFAPTTGTTVTLIAGTNLIVPAGALLALTMTMPACTSGQNGLVIRFSSSQAVTTLTLNASSGSVIGTLGSFIQGQGNSYICRGADTTWYRLY